MKAINDSWLVGTSSGIYSPDHNGEWKRLGAYEFRITAFDRRKGRVLAATGSGLWEVREDRWIQRHDETLTEVMDVIDDGEPMIVASAYGLAFGNTEASGRTAWRWMSDDLTVNQRFANAITKTGDRILVGTEDGVLIYDADDNWLTSSLVGIPVRSLIKWGQAIYAGSDDGVWRSQSGQDWERVSDRLPVYALASAGTSLLAGTENGLCRSEDGHDWRAAGLSSMRVSAVEADPDDDGKWYAGGSPGGLWMTKDEGKSWLGIPEIGNDVEVISAPGGTS